MPRSRPPERPQRPPGWHRRYPGRTSRRSCGLRARPRSFEGFLRGVPSTRLPGLYVQLPRWIRRYAWRFALVDETGPRRGGLTVVPAVVRTPFWGDRPTVCRRREFLPSDRMFPCARAARGGVPFTALGALPRPHRRAAVFGSPDRGGGYARPDGRRHHLERQLDRAWRGRGRDAPGAARLQPRCRARRSVDGARRRPRVLLDYQARPQSPPRRA